MEIKTTVRYHQIPTKTGKINNTDNTNCGEDSEQLQLQQCVAERA